MTQVTGCQNKKAKRCHGAIALETDSLVKVDGANRLTPLPSEFKLLLFSGGINAAFPVFKHKMKSQGGPCFDRLSAAVK